MNPYTVGGVAIGPTGAYHAKLNSEYPLEYSRERTQTSGFSCKVY